MAGTVLLVRKSKYQEVIPRHCFEEYNKSSKSYLIEHTLKLAKMDFQYKQACKSEDKLVFQYRGLLKCYLTKSYGLITYHNLYVLGEDEFPSPDHWIFLKKKSNCFRLNLVPQQIALKECPRASEVACGCFSN